jgi:hypothetical protein
LANSGLLNKAPSASADRSEPACRSCRHTQALASLVAAGDWRIASSRVSIWRSCSGLAVRISASMAATAVRAWPIWYFTTSA